MEVISHCPRRQVRELPQGDAAHRIDQPRQRVINLRADACEACLVHNIGDGIARANFGGDGSKAALASAGQMHIVTCGDKQPRQRSARRARATIDQNLGNPVPPCVMVVRITRHPRAQIEFS